SKDGSPKNVYPIITSSGREVLPATWKKWRWNASHKKIFERSSKSSSANAMKARRDYYKELSKLLLMKATFLNSSSLPCPIMRFVTAETGKSPALADAPP
ncbi:16953_t:CDS:2, partial [Gigaspora rosea]